MKRVAAVVFSIAALSAPLAAQRSAAPAKPLQIYVMDTEGGKAALWVSPSGQSLLIDSGNPGDRDLNRIMAVINDAGVKQIDFLISTHYHVDHIGGLQELAKRIPIGQFIDHGASVEEREQVQGFQAAYTELYGKAKHTVVKPGDKVPITGLDWRIVSSAGNALKTPLPGGGKPNPACAGVAPKDASPTDDNGQSVGSVVTFGQFRAIDLGDLLWNRENDLMCPNNPVGPVDVYFVTHHGLDASNSPALVYGVQPRVAVMQNGTRKGAGAQTMTTLRTSPGLEDIWQLHWSVQCRDRAEQRRRLRRQRGRCGDDCERAHGAAARRWSGRSRARWARRSSRRCGRAGWWWAARRWAARCGCGAAGRWSGRARRGDAACRCTARRAGGIRRSGWRARCCGRGCGAYASLLDQGIGPAGRHVHRHEQPQRIHQDLREAPVNVFSEGRATGHGKTIGRQGIVASAARRRAAQGD